MLEHNPNEDSIKNDRHLFGKVILIEMFMETIDNYFG